MEIADALYGVTMRGDGVTQVISQRLREAGQQLSGEQSSEEPAPEELAPKL
jgi:chromosome segregation protein